MIYLAIYIIIAAFVAIAIGYANTAKNEDIPPFVPLFWPLLLAAFVFMAPYFLGEHIANKKLEKRK